MVKLLSGRLLDSYMGKEDAFVLEEDRILIILVYLIGIVIRENLFLLMGQEMNPFMMQTISTCS